MKHSSDSVHTNYFAFHCVDGPELLNEAYRIRHQVYCIECGYLDPDDYPDGLEIDPFDDAAAHLLGIHSNGQAAGTVRLVLHSQRGFPMQEHCAFFPEYEHLAKVGREDTQSFAEISRLAVSKMFRQRADDTDLSGLPRFSPIDAPAPPYPNSGYDPKVMGPEIVAGLYASIYRESKRLGLTHWVVAMERSLYILLKRMGFPFFVIGPSLDYYGPVAPYIAKISDMEQTLYRKRVEILHYWTKGLAREYWPEKLLQEPDRKLTIVAPGFETAP